MLNSSLKNARLLIIDDQESNIALLESVLERDGYTDLRSTTDSRQVITLLDKFQPDLILLDLSMPHLDGFAVMEQLRVHILPEDYLPVLVLTADITPEAKLRALAVGARDFLTKPFDVTEVSLRIRNLLETRYLHLQQKNQNQILEEKIHERTVELRQRMEDLALINALNVAINQGVDLQKSIVLMADELHRIFNCIGTMTAFPNADKKSIDVQHIEFPSPLANQIENLAGASIRSMPLKIPMTGTGQFAQALRAGTPKAINDADTIKAALAEFTENKLLKRLVSPAYETLGIESMLLIPLISGTEILGLLEMTRTETTTEADLYRVQGIAGQLTTAIGRKRSEQLLLESEQRFRAVVQTANDAIVTMDVQGKVVSWNTAAETVFGFLAGEALGMSIQRIVPEKYRLQMERGVERLLASTERRIMGRMVEVTGLAKDGREFPIEMSLTEWETQAGKFFTSIIRDTTERKQSEEHIRQSEKKYRELFDVNKDGIAIFLLNPHGPPGTFVELNNAAPKMLGYTREEMLNLTPMMLEPHATQEQVQVRQSELEAKRITNFETVLRHKDGHLVFTEFSTQVIHYQGQLAVMNIVRDISERKQRENELQAIASLSAALRTTSSRAEMLPVIVKQLSNLPNNDSISIETIDPVTNETVVEAAYGIWASIVGVRQPPETGLNDVILKTKQPYHNNNFKELSKIALPGISMEGIHAIAGVPLIAQEQVIGILWVGWKTEIAESEVHLLAAVADITANAVHRATLHEQTQKNALDITHAYNTTLEGWAYALELRDQETVGHARNVVQMTIELARGMGISEDELEHVRRGALLHDIGKMGIPDSVLLKPGLLNEDEWEIMRKHPGFAYQFLEPIQYLHPALDIPYCHHEKWDGSGYPRGLKGEEIPLVARIFAIVDVWDALRSDRPYRKAWASEKAREYIVDQSGVHFDPQVVQAFLEMLGNEESPLQKPLLTAKSAKNPKEIQ